MTENDVRQQARKDYREDCLYNPYVKGTFERIIYHDESQIITFEEINHAC